METLIIRFIVQKGFSFEVEQDPQVTLQIPQEILKFDISKKETTSYNIYSFKSLPFNSELSEQTIEDIVDSLYLLSLDLDIGILIDPDLKSSWIAKPFLDELESKYETEFYDDFIGAKIVKPNAVCISTSPVTLKCTTSIENFEKLFNKYLSLNFRKSKRLFRAIEIYNSSTYLTILNRSGRFILQMTAIESLIDPPEVSNRLNRSLNSYIKRVKKLKIKNDERDSVLGAFSRLKKRSIKQSGKMLVEQLLDKRTLYNGYPPASFFCKAYDLRSKFVHEGITNTKYLDIKTVQIQVFTKDILKAYLNKTWS